MTAELPPLRTPAPRLPPPTSERGAIGWLRHHLFRTWQRRAAHGGPAGHRSAGCWSSWRRWAFTTARWGVITDNLRLFLIGLYPAAGGMARLAVPDQPARSWPEPRPAAGAGRADHGHLAHARASSWWPSCMLVADGAVAVVALVANAVAGARGRSWRRAGTRCPARWLTRGRGWLSLPLTAVLLRGIAARSGMPRRRPRPVGWAAADVPAGGHLASCSRSRWACCWRWADAARLPAIRLLCTAFIEVVRGVPLVTIIFLADIMLPLFLPDEVAVDRVVRAIGGFTLFTAAYVAENVRGGLQAIPRGQVEAAQALGLGGLQVDRFIVLPQALRVVIPANVGLFISLLKDTTLVVIVGLLEILGIGRAVLAQPEWLGTSSRSTCSWRVVFFVLCYTISHASYRLEAALGVGRR